MLVTLFPDFGGLGASGDPCDPTPASQEATKPKKVRCVNPILKPLLVIFGYFEQCIFQSIFQCPHSAHSGRFRSQKLPKREVLGDPFEDFLGVGPQCEN